MAHLPPQAARVVDLLGLVPHPEGGFFLETWRSGVAPMTTNGQTGVAVPEPQLRYLGESAFGENSGGDGRRNWLTSIYYLPTKAMSLLLGYNQSDHVHYFHGGLAFKYILVFPDGHVEEHVLGSDIANGQVMQLAVPGGQGIWKCGHVVPEERSAFEYSLIGEGVSPGFDFRDFAVVTKEMVVERNASLLDKLQRYMRTEEEVSGKDGGFDDYYDGSRQQERAAERLDFSTS
eukprot:scaffold535_cov260-Pinguiococcus_pyrenoidosus.AAC.27